MEDQVFEVEVTKAAFSRTLTRNLSKIPFATFGLTMSEWYVITTQRGLQRQKSTWPREMGHGFGLLNL